MKKGVIFDIKEFAVFDGPGIRQTVFLKGCPLRCSWCHNPEGLCKAPQLMVSQASCIHCGKCQEVCEHENCISCGACVAACPLHLRRIAGTELTSVQLTEKIKENSDYYSCYGGGVTFSGGEPLMQAEFLTEVLKQLDGIHCAIETSGYCQEEQFQKVLEHLDFVMMDIKLIDREKHKFYTGVFNDIILKNAAVLCSGDVPFVIRIPVIPGVNDNEKNYEETAKFLEGAKALQKVELLPYHKTAGAKYTMLGKGYKPDFNPEQKIWISQKIFSEHGIRSEVL